MKKTSKIYLAGHKGLVGSAILRRLRSERYENHVCRTHQELDLTRQKQVEDFFRKERPEYVILAAAKVGGIWANSNYPAEFIYNNLAIQTNVLHAAWKAGVKRLLFLGSSCIYPKDCPQPMKEDYFLSGPLETTNRPYAVAKIAGIIQCECYNRQYGTRFLAVMPTNLYGPNDNFDLETSHVLPALIRKFHLAKLASKGDWNTIDRDKRLFGPIPDDFRASLIAITKANGHNSKVPSSYSILPTEAPPKAVLWGTGSSRREFLHVDDLADACLFLMNLSHDQFSSLLKANCIIPLVNIGWGKDQTIKEFASLVKRLVGYQGEIVWDSTKPDGTPRKLLDISQLTALGWLPCIDLEAGIKSTYEWYLTHIG